MLFNFKIDLINYFTNKIIHHYLYQFNMYIYFKLKLKKIKRQLKEQRKLIVQWEDNVPEWIVDRCDTAGFGARLIDQIISTEMMPGLTDGLLASLARGEVPQNVTIKVVGEGAEAKLKLDVF